MPTRRSFPSLPSLLVLASSALALGAIAPLSLGQSRMMITSTAEVGTGGGGEAGEGLVPWRSVERYGKVLKFQPDQKEAIKTLHEGYASAFRDSSKQRNEAIQKLLHDSEDEEDRMAMMKKMPEIQEKHAETAKRLEKSLFTDIKAMLSPEQDAQWSKVERMRRREVGLRGGVVGGDSVDLTGVLDEMRLAEGDLAPLGEALEQYEGEMDRQLSEKEKETKTDTGWAPGKPIDIEAMQAAMTKAREQGVKLRDLNERHARRIENVLPEAKRSEFASSVRKASFPRVYRESRATKEIDASLKFDDLSSEQRKQVETIRDQYKRDAAPLNDAWATAQRDADEKGDNGGMLMGPGGARMRMSFGAEGDAEPKGPLADAKKARKDLDKRTQDRLKEVLTEAQRDKLPKEEMGEEGEFGPGVQGGGGARVIRRGG